MSWTRVLRSSLPPFRRTRVELTRKPRPRRAIRKPLLEQLEGRTVPATLVVNTTLDENDGAATLMLPLGGNPAGPDGLLSLREAINAANFYAGADTITFNIPTTIPNTPPGDYNGQWWTIRLDPALNAADGGGLPIILNDGTTIDGTTQPGYSTANVVGAGGTVGVDNVPLPQYPKPKIAIQGTQAPNAFQLDNSASHIRIKGMSVYDSQNAIKGSVYGTNFTVGTDRIVEWMFLGVLPNGNDPMTLLPAFTDPLNPPPVLAGTSPRNTGFGVVLDDSTPDFITPPTIDTSLTVRNCYVGYNGFSGICSRQEFLGPYCQLTVTGNEVFANGWGHLYQDGIVFGGRNSLARGNLSRENTTATGLPRGEGGGGIEMENFSASPDAGNNVVENNTVKNNVSAGIADIQGQDGNQIVKNVIFGNQVGISVNQEDSFVYPPTNRILISRNSTYLNFGLGNDLEDQQTVGPWELFASPGGRNPLAGPPGSTTPILDGVTPNDLRDPDTYSNDLQNWPVLTSAITTGGPQGGSDGDSDDCDDDGHGASSSTSTSGSTNIQGTLNSLPNSTFTIEFFWTPDTNLFAPDDREGRYFIGTKSVTTDLLGNASFNVTFNLGIPTTSLIFATATCTATSAIGGAIDDTSEFSNGTEVTQLSGVGKVTGGGYINPATVVTSSPATNSSDRRANFGFNAKYKDNDPTPTGHTNFVWKPGNVHFGSTSYAAFSLVVTTDPDGSQHARWRGLGKLNGTSGYGFEVNVTDRGEPGTSDSFRIHIWKEVDGNPNTEEGTIYDNGSDFTETTLTGGNIQVHMQSNPEEAHGRVAVNGANVGVLTSAVLQPVLEQAIANWRQAGLPPAQLSALDHPTIQIVDLSDSLLGLTAGTIIGIDVNAAGYGWFTSASPGATPAAGQMDLLTVVTHELGHLLGYGDTVEPGIMAGTLATGVRIFPDSAAPITPTTTSFTLTNPTAGDLARVAPHLAVVASDGLAPTLDATARLREATVSAAAFATRADSFVSAATEARAAASSTAGTLAMGPAVFVPAPAISLVPGFWSVDVRTNGSSAGTSNPATASDENEERPTGPVSPADTGDESRKPVQPDETALPAMPVLPKSKFGAAPLLVVIEWLKACAADLTDGPDCTPILVDEGDDPFATREAKDGPAGDALGALAALAFVLGSRPTVTASRREAEGRRRSRFSATHGAEKDR